MKNSRKWVGDWVIFSPLEFKSTTKGLAFTKPYFVFKKKKKKTVCSQAFGRICTWFVTKRGGFGWRYVWGESLFRITKVVASNTALAPQAFAKGLWFGGCALSFKRRGRRISLSSRFPVRTKVWECPVPRTPRGGAAKRGPVLCSGLMPLDGVENQSLPDSLIRRQQ